MGERTMNRIVVGVEPQTRTETWPGADVEQGPLLAAALAAALVEYRRYVGQKSGHAGPDGDRTNWQMAGRLEQLRGQA
jgi:hypothetical protein